MSGPKIILVSIMKNEADILPYWLNIVGNKVDYMMFRDNESSDNSIGIVKSHPKTIFCETVKGPFSINMWNSLISKVREKFTTNDWIYMSAIDVIPFFDLYEKINIIKNKDISYNCIKIFKPCFFFTSEMYKKYKTDENYKKVIQNFNMKNYKYFYNVCNSFPSLIQNVKGVSVSAISDFPRYPNRKIFHDVNDPLCSGHYRFRNPEQMQDRLNIRKDAINKGTKTFGHYKKTWNVEEYFISQKFLHLYNPEEGFKGKLNRLQLIQLISRNSRFISKNIKRKKKK